MEGSVNGLGRNLGSLDPKEGKEASDVEKKMSFHLVAEFMKKTQEELLQLADMIQSDQKDRELLQIKEARKVQDEKLDMMKDEILQLKADVKEINGKIAATHEAIESLDQRILHLEDHIPVVNTGDEAAVEKARMKAAATPNFKKLAIFVGVPILVALATKKLGFFTYLKKEPKQWLRGEGKEGFLRQVEGKGDAYAKEETKEEAKDMFSFLPWN